MEKKDTKNVEEEISLFDMLFDDENTDNVVLYDEKNNPIEFEQIALIPIKDEAYALLKPVKKMKGVEEDEAIVFHLEETEEGEELLEVETNEEMVDQVFKEYEKLLQE